MREPRRHPDDADVDLHVATERGELRPIPLPMLAAISAAGVLGTAARYGLGVAWPHPPTGFPWATLVFNVSACALIGMVMAIATQVATDC